MGRRENSQSQRCQSVRKLERSFATCDENFSLEKQAGNCLDEKRSVESQKGSTDKQLVHSEE